MFGWTHDAARRLVPVPEQQKILRRIRKLAADAGCRRASEGAAGAAQGGGAGRMRDRSSLKNWRCETRTLAISLRLFVSIAAPTLADVTIIGVGPYSSGSWTADRTADGV